MTLAPGVRLCVYEITAPVGEGENLAVSVEAPASSLSVPYLEPPGLATSTPDPDGRVVQGFLIR